MNRQFWRGRRVLLTGHTGFKGAWAAALLGELGAEVTGISLPPDSDPSLWALTGARIPGRSRLVDLRDPAAVDGACREAQPQIVLHMAAQALVRRSYADPRETYASNVMGTVNLLESLRRSGAVRTVLVITSDKVYRNAGAGQELGESAELGGSDPYSASKGACELVVRSYRESFLAAQGVAIATARGGNVLGGGDFSADRLVPDIYRAIRAGRPVELRYPEARRPWQHVLDCLSGYLAYAELLHESRGDCPQALNFGPDAGSELTVAELASAMGRLMGRPEAWRPAPGTHPPEKEVLRLDVGMARSALGWMPMLDGDTTLSWTAAWYSAYAKGQDALSLTLEQIRQYLQPAG